MLCNVENFTQFLAKILHCTNNEEFLKLFEEANYERRNWGLTEFEYLSIEKSILEKLNLPTSLSRYRGKLNLKKIIESNQNN